MKVHHSELISALVDGELKGVRRWLVQRHVDRCALCASESRHLLHVREMLAANLPATPMSDSPEFFWSKVKREIHKREGQSADVPTASLSWSDWLGRRSVALASAVASARAVGSASPKPVATVRVAATPISNGSVQPKVSATPIAR